MQLRKLTGSTTWTAIALTAAACAGTLDDAQFDDVIGAQAELVQKKRDWLAGYDRHCGVCFEAFKLCEKGSSDLSDAANCEASLDACVRGGLINDDAGAISADASSASTDVDPAPSDDAGIAPGADAAIPFDAGDSLLADTGQAGVSGAFDASRRPTGRQDSGAPSEDGGDAGDAIDLRGDAGGRARPPPPADRNQLAQSVGQCLSQTHDCLATAAGAQNCVGALRECVRSALTQSLANVCSTQLASCRAEGAPANAVRSVERLCRSELGFATDAQ